VPDEFGKLKVYTHTCVCIAMGTRNISISDQAYAKLAAMKGPRESFTDVINRLAGKKSVLDLAGVLSAREAADLRSNVRIIRSHSKDRLAATTRRMSGS
jgi:predicted CopG family antitoxin